MAPLQDQHGEQGPAGVSPAQPRSEQPSESKTRHSLKGTKASTVRHGRPEAGLGRARRGPGQTQRGLVRHGLAKATHGQREACRSPAHFPFAV